MNQYLKEQKHLLNIGQGKKRKIMKNKIENKIKLSGLKYWKAFAISVNRDPSNFKRTFFANIDKINGWLKEIGLELCVKETDTP
ncbi:MAG: hypothetical protein DRJ01_17885 [Bacteroidetes bacterium]|nr:MAG: hypothetical protein DRJ01_17885 [Bacteroidota bacterium]